MATSYRNRTMKNTFTGKMMYGSVGSAAETGTYRVIDAATPRHTKLYFNTEDEYQQWIRNGRRDLKTLEEEGWEQDEDGNWFLNSEEEQDDEDYYALDPDDDISVLNMNSYTLNKSDKAPTTGIIWADFCDN